MYLPNFLAAAAVLAFVATAVPTKRDSDRSIIGSGHRARAYQAASDLKNVSTYHALTRVQGLAGQLYKEAYRRGHFRDYGLSPTTSYGKVSCYQSLSLPLLELLTITLGSSFLYTSEIRHPNFQPPC